MRQIIHMTFVSILLAAFLPVTAWGFGFTDYPGDRGYQPYAGSAGGSRYSGSLRVEKGMTGDGYYVHAWLDGLRPEDVQVYLRRNRLVLQVDQGDQYGLYNPNARRSSQWQMSFRRQLRLPYDADGARMTTSTKDGIMEIYIPRRGQYMPADPSLNQ
jgi:HSP20 family molecular chaperone IbpA